MNYPKIRKRYALTSDDIQRTVANLLKYSVLVQDPTISNVIEQDPDDNKILATAIAGKADYIISGDMHLLTLNNYRGIDIVTPKRFCEITPK